MERRKEFPGDMAVYMTIYHWYRIGQIADPIVALFNI